MALDLSQISTEIKTPSRRNQILQAKEQQEWIKFHADTSFNFVSSVPYERFKAFVKSLLPADKFALTMNLLKFPIPTNEVTESVFVKLSKIFDGRNPAFNYQFHNTEQRDDWEWYRQEVLGEPNVWSTKAWEYFKTEINCIVVVDLPTEDKTDDPYPRPYFYFVPIDNVISYSVNRETGNMDWVIFKNKGKVISIDDQYYRTFTLDGRRNIVNESVVENPHGLGFCPARFFWNESLTLSAPDVKKSPLSKELSELNWYLFYALSKRHLDLYGSYPILSGYEEECDYIDKDGNSCHKGHLQKPDGTILTDEAGNPVLCPICGAKKNLAGAGTYVEVPIPDKDQPDLRNPIQMLTVDKQSLDYNVEEVERLRKKIVSACVGLDNSILNETSLADKQVDATYESQETVLNRVKKGFEVIQEFVDSTCCLLRYGEAFISCKINYGTEFYTLTPEVLQKRYSDAKKGGASDAELDALRQQLIETQYRHNPIMLQRMIILSDLEPYRHLSREEVKTMHDDRLMTDEEYIVKSNFTALVKRFERENDNILEFGTKMPYSKKIDTIYTTLLGYAKESIPARQDTIPTNQ